MATRHLSVFLALRNLRRRPLRAVLTTTGIILGVGMVVGVLSLSSTLLRGFQDLFDVAYGKTDLVVSKNLGGGPPSPFPARVLGQVKAVPGVDATATTGQVFGTAYLVGADGKVKSGASNILNLSGVEPGKSGVVSSYSVVAGRDVARPGDFVVEDGWARDKRLRVGDTVAAAVPAGRRDFRITGIFRFDRSVNFGGTGFAAETLAAAQRDLNLPGQLSQVYVRSTDRSQVPELQKRVQAALGSALVVRTPSGQVDQLSKQLSGLNTFLLFFAGVALFVGGFLIFNAFNVTVLQRTREIGMMRTLGATRRGIVRQVLVEGVAMGLIGSLLGLLAGVGLAIGLIALMSRFFEGIPFGSLRVPLSALIWGLVVGVLVTAFAALFPALRAGRTSPLQAMRRRAERVGRLPWRSALVGLGLIAVSAPGVWLLAKGDGGAATTYGFLGILGLFLGVALAAPLVVRPLVRALAAPMRALGRTESRLAADNAARAPGRTALTASAVMIGLALVIMFSAFSEAGIAAVRNSIDDSLQSDFIVTPRNLFSNEGFSPALGRRIAALPGTRAATATRSGFARVDGDQTQLVGVDPATYGNVARTQLDGGGRPDWGALAGPAVFVTTAYARDHHLSRGATVSIARPGAAPDRVAVAGIVDDKLETNGSGVIVSSSRAARDAGLTQDFRVYVKAGDSPAARAALRTRLDRLAAGYPAAKVLSNEQLKNEIESSFNQIFGFLYALLGVAIVASVVGVVNTLVMSVVERTREIGMLRAMGGTRGQLRGMIRRESVLVTLVGVVLGLVVGLVLGYVFVRASASSFPGLEFVFPWLTVVLVVVGAILVGLLAAVLPARRAARLNVIEAVGYE